ncbi:MAG: glycoside hydrolase family 3 C-terminal domain-containing protein [Clostridia bacterium]|nr:glycoside hydrolase family 3 C-terminal domain-containing protein [Clostridia bacterium]
MAHTNILFDASRPFEERISWLLDNLTCQEKLSWLSSLMPACERLGIAPFGLGGEAAHGVEARNDQNGLGAPDITTSFPQPIGMSATWDPELIRACGEVVGVEARVVSQRHPGRGLSRWAPTVDLERDPRWGRNEEGYGEDPLLTGCMAGAYIRGMQGDDEKYIRTAATLKHFYANNTEEGRAWKNADVDPRNKYELYLEPFRRCIEDSHAQGIMTAYNRINGKVGILNDEVTAILKEQYGLNHAVGDGGALNLVVSGQHYYGNHAQAIADALKAGVDGMSDNPAMVERAAQDAWEQGLITEADLDRAIRNKLLVAMRLGHYDGDANPYSHVTEADLCTDAASALALRAAEESLVLLQNDGLLPLDKSRKVALIGPMADRWFQDWYGGEPPCRVTLKDGLDQLHAPYEHCDGWDRVILRFADKGARVNDDGSVSLSDEPDVFIMEDWGDNAYTFRCVRTGKYLCMTMPGGPSTQHNPLGAQREHPFNWFVLEVFHIEGDHLLNRFHWPVDVQDGQLVSGSSFTGAPLTIEVVESGITRAVSLAKQADTVVLALGNSPMIPAKEELDRHTICLPPQQQCLLECVHQANPRTALVLMTNYPYAIPYAKDNLPAVLLSATGAQSMGQAVANTLYGLAAPAGRLNMTWYRSDDQLPDIDDYDIIRGKRTYRYFDGQVLYPFGHGCTYTSFAYHDLHVACEDGQLHFTFTVENTGPAASDEVAQVYGIAPASRVQKPLRQLLAFTRLHDMQPGEKRTVHLTAPVAELRFYDVISRRLMVEEGEYRFFAGPSSAEEAARARCHIPGETTGLRDMQRITPADHYDDCEHITLLQGTLGYTCVSPRLDAPQASVTYRDCQFDPEHGLLSLRVMSRTGGSITVLLNGQEIGQWQGDTRTCEHRSAPPMDRYAYRDIEARARERQPIWEDIDFLLPEDAVQGSITLLLSGDVQVSFMQARTTPGERKIRLGIAN